MAQFFVYQNKNTHTNQHFPFLLNIQTDLLDALATCVVVPLCEFEKNQNLRLTNLTPVLNISEKNYLMLTPQIAGIAKKELGEFVVDLSAQRTEIINAIDFLLSGI